MSHLAPHPVTPEMRQALVRRFDEILGTVGNVSHSVTGQALEVEIFGRSHAKDDYVSTANRVLMKLTQRSQTATSANSGMRVQSQRGTASQPTIPAVQVPAVANPYGPTSNAISTSGSVPNQLIPQARHVDVPLTSISAIQQSGSVQAYSMGASETVRSYQQSVHPTHVTIASQSNSTLPTSVTSLGQPEPQMHSYRAVTSGLQPPMAGGAVSVAAASVSTIGMVPQSIVQSVPASTTVQSMITRVAPVASVPVHSTMASSLPPSFDGTMAIAQPPPHVSQSQLPSTSTVPTTGSLSVSSTSGSTTEEQLYMEKLSQLSKYINPVKRMLVRMSRDKRSPREIQKLKSLLEILENPQKKVQMSVLETCETVLSRLISEASVQSPTVHPTTTVATTQPEVTAPPAPPVSRGGVQLLVPLIKTVARLSESPTLAHNMQMAFNPALRTIDGPVKRQHVPDEPFPEERLPKKKRTDSSSGLPQVVEKELRHIKQVGRFRVEVTSSNESPLAMMTGTTLSFSYVASPYVPRVEVQIPHDYPTHCPQLLPMKSSIAQNWAAAYSVLQAQLRNLPGRFTLTQLLGAWDLSVRSVGPQ